MYVLIILAALVVVVGIALIAISPKLATNALSMPETKLLQRRDKLSDYLEYEAFDDKSELYHFKDEMKGFIFELTPRQFAGSETAKTFEDMFEKISEDMICQINYISLKNDFGRLKAYETLHRERLNNDNNLTAEARSLIEFSLENVLKFYKEKLNGSVTQSMKMRARNVVILFSLKGKDEAAIKELKIQFENSLRGKNFYPKVVKPQHLIDIVFELINSNHEVGDIRKYNEFEPISKALVAYDSEFIFTNQYAKFDGGYWACLSPSGYGSFCSLGMFCEKVGNFSEPTAFDAQFIDNVNVSYTIKRKNQKAIDKVNENHTGTTKAIGANYFLKLREVQKESDLIRQKIETERKKLYDVDLNVMVRGKDEKALKSNVILAQEFWKVGGENGAIDLKRTDGIHQVAFLASLPCHTSMAYYEIANKSTSMFGDSATQYLPICADWTGTPNSNLVMFSRRGQLTSFDMFDSNSNFNGYVIAGSGSGKSVFLNSLAFNSFLANRKIFIMDFGASFQKLCEICGGSWIEPSQKNPQCYNPFSVIRDREHLQKELEFFSLFVYGLGASKNADEYQRNEAFMKSLLSFVILRVYDEIGTKMTMTNINDFLLEMLKNPQEILDELARENEQSAQILANITYFTQNSTAFKDVIMLYSTTLNKFCKGGVYGAFFEGDCEVDFSNDFIVCELQEMENDLDLRSALVCVFNYHKSAAIYGDKSANKKRIVSIYDEAHKYINKDPQTDNAMEQEYRRGRKEGLSVILATQGFGDIYDGKNLSKIGSAIISSSAWNFFLKQESSSVQLLKQSNLFSYIFENGYIENMMKSATRHGFEFSEIFVKTPYENVAVVRLVMDRFFYYITSSNADDKRKIKALTDTGLTTAEAINELIRQENEKAA